MSRQATESGPIARIQEEALPLLAASHRALLSAQRAILAAPPYLLLAVSYLIAVYLFLSNSASGQPAGLTSLPLDDSWLRTVHARSFGEHFRFNLNEAEPTAGVTSPLWAATVGTVWRLSGANDDQIVAVAKVLGIAFGLGAGMLVFRITARLTRSEHLGLLAGFLLLLQPGFVFASVSGFEVAMAAFLALAAAWTFMLGRLKLTGLLLGALVVTRPEMLVFGGLVAGALVVRRMWERDQLGFLTADDARQLAWLLGPTALLAGAWAIYNVSAGGGPWPNGYYARHQDLGLLPFGNIANAVRGYYHGLPYFAGFVFPITVAVLGTGVWALLKRHGFPAAPLALFVIAQTYAIAVTFPLPSSRWPFYFQRYLDVTYPFLAIILVVGWAAIWQLFGELRRSRAPADPRELRLFSFALSALFVAIVALPLVAAPARWSRLAGVYSWNTRNIDEVHVATALWIRDHTEPDAVIAVDSPGAIAFFGERRLVDLTGVNTPAAIGRTAFDTLASERVDYLFAFRSVHFESWINGVEVYRVEAARNTVLPGAVMKGWRAEWDRQAPMADADQLHLLDPDTLGLSIIDQIDTGNAAAENAVSEVRHEYSIAGQGGDVTRSFKLDTAGTIVQDDARTFTGSEEFLVRAVPGRRLVIARRYDAAVAGALRVFADGRDTGLWELPEREFFFGEGTFTVAPEFITANTVRIRLVHVPRPGGLPANSFYSWFLVDQPAVAR